MHFWIDKPTGRCSRFQGRRFHGRRYPMNFPKDNFAGHNPRCVNQDATRLQMFPPVHRYQNNDGNSAGPSNPRSHRPSVQENIGDHRNEALQSGFQLGQDNISNNPNNTSNNQRVLPQSSNDSGRSLLNVFECNEADMKVYNVGITLVTVIAFLAVTRFYFDSQQNEGLQVIVIFGLLAFLIMYRCMIRLLCPIVPSNHIPETPTEPIATVTVLNTISNESISEVSMPIRQNPPPPYHIAILIPPPTSPDEAPPPAYDKIVH